MLRNAFLTSVEAIRQIGSAKHKEPLDNPDSLMAMSKVVVPLTKEGEGGLARVGAAWRRTDAGSFAWTFSVCSHGQKHLGLGL